MTTTTTPKPLPPPSRMCALDIRCAATEAGAQIAGARALIDRHRKSIPDLEAAESLLLGASSMLAGLADDCMEGVEA